jgi:hypothetical protein
MSDENRTPDQPAPDQPAQPEQPIGDAPTAAWTPPSAAPPPRYSIVALYFLGGQVSILSTQGTPIQP